MPAESFTATTSMTLSATVTGARAGLVVLGDTYSWVGLSRDESGRITLVHRSAAKDATEVDAAPPVPLGRKHARVRLRVTVGPGAVGQFSVDVEGRGFTPVGAPFTATPGRWIGATVGIFATAPQTATNAGVAEFDWFRVGP